MKKKDKINEIVTDKNEEYKPKVPFLNKIPFVIKALVLKYWFYGLGYFLIMNGIGYFFQELTYFIAFCLILGLGVAYGILFDIFLYNIYDVLEIYPGESKPYTLFKRRGKLGILSLLINTVYGIIIAFSTSLIGALFMKIPGNPGFGAEAFSYALIALILDAVVLSIKYLIVYLIHRKD